MKGNEAFGYEIIKKLQEKYPNWKMNVKYDDRQKTARNRAIFPNNMPYPPQNTMPYPPYPVQMQRPTYPNFMQQPSPQNMQIPQPVPSNSEKIVGAKPCRIFVR